MTNKPTTAVASTVIDNALEAIEFVSGSCKPGEDLYDVLTRLENPPFAIISVRGSDPARLLVNGHDLGWIGGRGFPTTGQLKERIRKLLNGDFRATDSAKTCVREALNL